MELKELLEKYIKTLKDRNYSRSTIKRMKKTAGLLLDYMASKKTVDYMKAPREFLNGFREHLERVWKYAETSVNSYEMQAGAFLKSCGVPIAKKNTGESEKEIYTFPAEFQAAYFEYIRKRELEETPENSMKKMGFNIRQFYRYLALERAVKNFAEISREDLREFAKYLVDLTGDDGERNYNTASVNRSLADIRTFLVWLGKRGLCSPGFSYDIRHLKQEESLSRNILTRKEVVRFFNVKAENPHEFMMKAIMALLYATGVRIGELLALELSHVDLEKGEAVIYEPKTKKSRAVILGEVGTEYLKLYLEKARPFIRPRGVEEDPKLFLSRIDGKPLADNTVNDYLKEFCRRAGIQKHITCHCFRHSYGSHILENGAGIKEVCDLLGHKGIKATERYTQLSPERLRQTILTYHPREAERGVPQ
jgi:site-specific recombinase XerD